MPAGEGAIGVFFINLSGEGLERRHGGGRAGPAGRALRGFGNFEVAPSTQLPFPLCREMQMLLNLCPAEGIS